MLRALLNALAPLSCPCCAAFTDGPCCRCVEMWRAAPSLAVPPGLAQCRAVYSYSDGVESVVLAMKRTRRHGLAPWMAASMLPAALEMATTLPPDVLTWAPTTTSRARSRGFDHGEELARALARQLDVPVRRLLRRTSDAVSHSTAIERSQTTFEAVTPFGTIGATQRIWVIDDVRTTGSTLAAASAALRSRLPAGGSATVAALTFAATPRPAARRATDTPPGPRTTLTSTNLEGQVPENRR